tara:strand:+ start:149 stop:550 length:402 start_codon:yes stop_codon:yes gene_type:complete
MDNRENILLYEKYKSLLGITPIHCDIGWDKILDEMLSAIKIYMDVNQEKYSIPPIIFTSIKEKFGVLEIMAEGGDEVTQEIINFTIKLSYKTCEFCGKIGLLYCSTKWLHWSFTKTLCKNHAVSLLYYNITHR